jgi:exonuclease SbcC
LPTLSPWRSDQRRGGPQRTAELIAPCRLRRHAQLLLAPLEPWSDPCSDASGTYSYYGQLERISATATALRRKRQRPLRQLLVIVDGPPGATGPQARYPALPALLDAIPADPAHPLQVTLLLDDLHRPEEQAIAAAWQALLAARGIAATRRDHGFEKGALELRFAL